MEKNIQNQPLVSIITVCFNSAATIRRTIESILYQTYTNIEYILIDGLSKDNTVAIIREYENSFVEKGISYRWVSEKDAGIYDAMNKGIKMSNGAWLNIQGSDDWLELNAIEVFVKSLVETTSAQIYWFGANIILDKYKLINKPNLSNPPKHKLIGCHQAAFVHANLMKSGFNLRYRLAADYEFVLKHFLIGTKIAISNEIIANYSLGGASNNNQLKTINEYKQISIELKNGKFMLIWVHFLMLKCRLIITQQIKKIISPQVYINLKHGKC